MEPKEQHEKQRRSFLVTLGLVALVTLWAAQLVMLRKAEPRDVTYDELIALVEAGKLESVELRDNELVGTAFKDAKGKQESVRTPRLPNIDEKPLVETLARNRVHYRGRIDKPSPWTSFFLSWVLPIGLLALFYGWGARRMRRSGPLTFGRSRAKIYDAAQAQPVTFADVAGVDEAVGELKEVVDFLKSPERYRSLGAHIPKGVLLVGPPGTGKTLLARAVAGEAKVPFFSITGSEFVEMFVGVGAARVRDLFEQAKQRTPCLVFIDEIDAIGRSRGGLGVMATNDEREQTLNQLLAEMDGFDPNSGVILMAATNRPEVLDPALLRAGRFDRQVVVDRPDVRGREAILRVHADRAPLATTVDLKIVAQRTPGMVGADLANVVNEAALGAARRGSKQVEQRDFEEAIDRIQLGLKKHGTVMNEREKRRVAHHEAGHALVALSLPHADPVHRVTIIPRSIGALGATLQLPLEDRYLVTREELRDRLCVLLAGRAAEELVFGDVSTGAADDLERATATARQMVTRFGMSHALGARTYGTPAQLQFLPVAATERDYGEASATLIDTEIRDLVESQRLRALGLLEDRRPALEAIAARLLDVETLDHDQLVTLASAPRRVAALP